jgi:hypothetical protein
MSIRISDYDVAVLLALAEHRVLTNGQMAALLSRSERSLRGRLTELAKAGYLAVDVSSTFGRGRPAKLVALTMTGLNLLKQQRKIPEETSARAVLPEGLGSLAHHEALNDFRVCLAILSSNHSALTTNFLTATSPFLRSTEAGRVFAADWLNDRVIDADSLRLVPDGVFMIRHVPNDKALLFFLEIDMGTESLGSAARPRADLCHKILDYQEYFRSGRFSRYDDAWKSRFHGFRVLFVTNSPERQTGVCRLVVVNPPSDFVWVADLNRIVTGGLAASVWRRGGRIDRPETSILGSEVSREVIEQARKHAVAEES